MNDIENPSLKKQYEEIVAEYNKPFERIEKACIQASKFVPLEFLNSVKEKLYKTMQKDYVSRLDYLKMLMGNNLIEEFKQEIISQKDVIQTSDDEVITPYERIFAIFFRNLKRSSQKDKIKEFIAIVHPNDFVKILNMTNKIRRLLNSHDSKNDSFSALQKDILEKKWHFEWFVNSFLKTWREIRQNVNFPKNPNFWEPRVKNILQKTREMAPDVYALVKDCEKKDLAFNAQTEDARLREYEDFLNNSTSYTRKESGLFAVNLYQFFINNYGYPHWLWVAELLNCLFDTNETEASIRQNLKKQLQQIKVFLPHIGLYYLKKKDEKEAL